MSGEGTGFRNLIGKPSAWLPLMLSLAVALLLLVTFVRGRLVPQADEGAEAHLFQILMAVQVPIIAIFAVQWLPRAPRQAIAVLALQVVAAVAVCAPVFLLGL